MQQATIPSGNAKGTPLTEADDKDIKYWLGRKKENLANDPDGKFAASDQRWITEAEAILASRSGQQGLPQRPAGNGARSQQSRGPAPQTRALAKPVSNSIIGSFGDPKMITEKLAEAARNYHLATPAMVCGRLPEGCEVVMSLVQIDPEDPKLYGVGGGKLCPDKVHLITILNAMGGSIEYSRRIDDGSHPHFCAVEVGICFRAFDGSLIRRCGTAEMDAREPDGPRYVEAVKQAEDKGRDPAAQLLQLRKFLYRHTESRALLAAISNAGIRRSYTKEELKKPFACASLMFTGHSADPEARRDFRQAIANSFLGGRDA
ncbi:MAG TPA: hypothetical protein VHO25_10520, partial [Polyangiaceae bacterium]|nr:hypothetical protein [Polyangiaceae bacterium]